MQRAPAWRPHYRPPHLARGPAVWGCRLRPFLSPWQTVARRPRGRLQRRWGRQWLAASVRRRAAARSPAACVAEQFRSKPMPEPRVIPIDVDEVGKLAAALRATSYHEHLARYVADRIAFLLDAELTDPNAILKCRGQVEELQHLLRPAFTQTLALLGLRAHAERDAANLEPPEPPPTRPWWVDPEPSAYPVP